MSRAPCQLQEPCESCDTLVILLIHFLVPRGRFVRHGKSLQANQRRGGCQCPLPASLPGASSSGPPKPVHALPFSQVSRLGRAVRGPRDVGIPHF